MKYLGVAGVLLGLSLLGVPALADEAKQPVPRVGQVVIESMGPASGTIPKGKLATIVNYIHADKHTWYKNGSRHTAKYPFNKGTQRNLHDRFVLKMRYGLGDGYDVRFATPIVMNNFRGCQLNNDAISFQLPLTWNLAKSAIVRSTISRVLDTTIDFLLKRANQCLCLPLFCSRYTVCDLL